MIISISFLIAWFAIVFFGFCAIISIVLLLPGAASLGLDRDGFEITSLFRRRRVRWRDASGFEVLDLPIRGARKQVVYDGTGMVAGALAKLNAKLAGRNAGLPDT